MRVSPAFEQKMRENRDLLTVSRDSKHTRATSKRADFGPKNSLLRGMAQFLLGPKHGLYEIISPTVTFCLRENILYQFTSMWLQK